MAETRRSEWGIGAVGDEAWSLDRLRQLDAVDHETLRFGEVHETALKESVSLTHGRGTMSFPEIEF